LQPINTAEHCVSVLESGIKMKVFISYCREDLIFAEKLYSDLSKSGITLWMDNKNILAGQNWKNSIRKAIKESSFFLALLSSNSVSKRGYVQKELKIALDIFKEFPENDIFIIPIRLDNVTIDNEDLSNLQWVNLYESYEVGLNNIMKVITIKKNGDTSVKPLLPPPLMDEKSSIFDQREQKVQYQYNVNGVFNFGNG